MSGTTPRQTSREVAKKNAPLITGIAALLTALAALIPQIQPKLAEYLDAKVALTKAEVEAIRKATAAGRIAAEAQLDIDAVETRYAEAFKVQASAIQDNYELIAALEQWKKAVDRRLTVTVRTADRGEMSQSQAAAAHLAKSFEDEPAPSRHSRKMKTRKKAVDAILKKAFEDESK